MSFTEIVRAFQQVPEATLREVATSEQGTLQELLQKIVARTVEFGVEAVVSRLEDDTVKALSKEALLLLQGTQNKVAGAEAVESALKKDLVGLLRLATPEAARLLARDLSLSGADSSQQDLELLRVRLFEESVLLGMEALLDQQKKQTLSALAEALHSPEAQRLKKEQVVEALMIKIFSLKGEDDGAADVENTPPRKDRKKQANGDDADADDERKDGDDDILKFSSDCTKSDVSRHKVNDLRKYCEHYKLAQSGLKPDLVDRVFAHASKARK